ncbi:MAG TPA: hypothetical protein VFL63_10265 [Rhodanobacteraceae bacterium]|nr:hypothetical protein [Rhodanobacteraceae bacterium]
MRKFLFIACFALLGTLGLAACSHSQNQTETTTRLTRPTDPTDINAWANYLKQIVTDNLGTISNPPYVYYVPSSQNPADAATIARVQEQVSNMVLGTVLPGNLVAVGGPSSATTAQVMETAFKGAAAGSFKGVVVLFIGDKADEEAVKEAVAPSGATFKFAQM